MISGPRTSWKTSSKRRSRPAGSTSFNAGEIKQNAIKKQLNPYKASLRDSLGSINGQLGHSTTRGITDDQDNFGSDIDLGESDEEFGIDDILKDIDSVPRPPAAAAASISSESNKDEKEENETNNDQAPPTATYEPKRKSKQAETKPPAQAETKPPARNVASVDFGDTKQGTDRARIGREIPRHRNSKDRESDELHTSAEEDNDTLLNDDFSDGDATKEHQMLVQTGQTPMFSSGGFDGDNKSRRRSCSSSADASDQFMDELVDDFDNEFGTDFDNDFDNDLNQFSYQKSDGTISTGTPDSAERAFRNLMNDYSSSMDKKVIKQERGQVQTDPPDGSAANETKESMSFTYSTKSPPASAVPKANIQEEETLSTVTDPTESPFIYTYKKDDDDVSQITSSVAGHSMGSAHLQNVSNNIGPDSAQNRNGITWMSGTALGQMPYRKPAGLYGRERGRKSAKLPKATSNGSVGSTSYDGIVGEGGGNSALDEIAYALNADTMGRNQRARRPQGRGLFDEGRNDDLSTIESQLSTSTGYISKPYSIDVKSNVSKLGMGGVSCSDTVGGTTVASDSSTNTFSAMYTGLFSLFFKAQHHAGRFFFPTSAAVTQRKKFDRSDSLEDILLEEGSKTPLAMTRTGRKSFDEEDIDYFGRAMGRSSTVRIPQQKKSCWQSTTLRMGVAFLFMTTALIIFKMPEAKKVQKKTNFELLIEQARKNGQTVDQANNALVDTSDIPKAQDTSVQMKPMSVVRVSPPLPSQFQSLANVDSGPFQKGIDVPFYWHVPRTGGGTVNDILGSCLHLTLAADAGGSEGESGVEMLKVLHFAHEVNYLNVDTSTLKGIQRAQDLNLVPSGLADVVISPLLHDATTLFTPTRKGRLFAIFRNPIERAASLFYFIQDTQWKQPGSGNEQFASMTIEQFYEAGFAENNWMTRFLTNELTKGELTEEDLNIAKEVLRQKCLIGLLDEKGETFERFQKYFGWRPKNGSEEECLAKKLEWAWSMKHRHPPVEEESDAYRLIRAQNMFDLQLYEYARELFQQQGQLFP